MSTLPEERPFIVTHAGRTLRGHFRDAPGPVGLFLHGFASNADGNKSLALARHAAEHGYAWLRVNLSGHGDSDGAFDEFKLSTLLADVEAVLAALPDRPVLLVGSSMGGWLAVLAALHHPRRICGLVLIAPAFNFIQTHFGALPPAELTQWQRAGWRAFEDHYEGSGYRLHHDVLADAAPFDVFASPVTLACPMILIHGEHDESVPLSVSQAFEHHATAPYKELHVIAGGDHRLNTATPLMCQAVDALWETCL
jgi:pimeloyl-ACP methyl ester carboxylesterase